MRMETQKNLTFGGLDSMSLGLYITGESVYNAPPRSYDMVVIPGRNGELAMDGNRWENIEVTYPAGIYASTWDEYRERIAQIRGEYASRLGYQKITDDYNPDEFRLGIYSSGLETEAVQHHTASEFDLVFNCKPQRYLTEGEEPVEMSGSTGESVLVYPYSDSTKTTNGIKFTSNSDGTVTATGTATADATFGVKRQNHSPYLTLSGLYKSSGCPEGGSEDTYYMTVTYGSGQEHFNPQYGVDTGAGFVFRANDNERTGVWIIIKAGTTVDNIVFDPSLAPLSGGSSGSGTVTNPTLFDATPEIIVAGTGTLGVGDHSLVISGTASQILHIDCDIMEVWEQSGASKQSRNDSVQFAGNKFPVLGSGTNGISWTSGISYVEIIPRWWRL